MVKVIRSEANRRCEDYFDIPVDAGGGVAIVSFFCAQAPRLSTPAATATIIIALTNFTINSPPSLAGCCRLFRRGNQRVQRNSRPFFLALDAHFRAERDLVEERNQIGVLHSNAAVARGLANLLFVVRAVNVNEAVARICIVRFEAIEPEDAREDQVIGRRRRFVGVRAGSRLRKMVPMGRSSPNFSPILNLPSGVFMLPSSEPRPKREVETG